MSKTLRPRAVRIVLPLLTLLGALASSPEAHAQPTSPIGLDAPLVADPKLDSSSGGLTTAGVAGGSAGVPVLFWGRAPASGLSYNASITIQKANGTTARQLLVNVPCTANVTWRIIWDGKTDAGTYAPPGAYGVRFDATGAVAGSLSRSFFVVRLGARSIRFLDDAVGGSRVPLAFHAASGKPRSYFAVDAAGASWTLARSPASDGALDDASGAPLAGPTPWTVLTAPPLDASGRLVERGRSLPVAYAGGGAMSAEVLLGDRSAAGGAAAACGYPIAGVPIRTRVVGGGPPSGPIAPGDRLALSVGTAATGLAKRTLWLDLAFEYQAPDGTWKPIGGFQRTVHTLYTLVGTSKLSAAGSVSPDAKEMPFVAAVDEVTSWVSPASPVTTAAGALEVVTRAVNQRKGLRYDDVAGASAYADGMNVTTQLAFSELLSGKARGSIVNCSDCSAIVSVYGRSVGADSESLILGWDFPLNFIRGIGFSDWKADVFNNGYPGFSYHAVTSRNQGVTIHDACLEVDDGPNPGSAWATRTPRLPVDMDYARYQQKLTPGWYTIQARGRPIQN